MNGHDFQELLREVRQAIIEGASAVGILGFTEDTLQLLAVLESYGVASKVLAVYASPSNTVHKLLGKVPILAFDALRDARLDVIVVADDVRKEDLLWSALPHVVGAPRVIIAGHGHFAFRDRAFDELQAQLLVPSLANGYPNSLIHLYQCLSNAARLGLQGVVAEFGMFKGGTTMFLSRAIERLGQTWRVLGFDTFRGFPPKRSMLDMYANQDCVFGDVEAVRSQFEGRNVEIVTGDIVNTCHRLDHESVILTFVDTDNYSSARAVLEVVRERTIVRGAIVFDHFTGVDRFRYTLGERMAGNILLEDRRYFNLHGTGVFYRQE